jgi:D-threo-aldose 1-dehydrogenase
MSATAPARLGMGTAAIGNLYRAVSDAEAWATLAAAFAAGIRYFDTAPHYGFGLAERRLGAALATLDPDQEAIVSTKVGRLLVPTQAEGIRHGFVDADPFEPVFDYSGDAILRSLDGSRRRLRRDRIDLLLAHDLGETTHGEAHEAHLGAFLATGYPAMRALRDRGEVDAIGIGVNEVAICETLLDRVELDAILIAGRYTLLDRGAEALLERCRALGVRVIVGGPYNSGILARDPAEIDAAALHYDYAQADPAIVARARRLAEICAEFGVALPDAALNFPLRHPQVASVIPGLVGEAQVADAVARFAASIPDALWAALDAAADPRPEGKVRLILLNDGDNVLISARAITSGEALPLGARTVRASADIPIGHKVARVPLRPGDKVIKYGAPIGSMTAAAEPGDWVHMHNMKSDYIAGHTRAAVKEGRS